ncbi:MAG TPA: hypothetical protein VK806_01280 [Bacteroidia bacterium]|jgi:hypothetical protein|nr:hypothetical protein [Bacteroidia bacterium]
MNTSNENNSNEEPEVKKPKFWGTIYFILGIVGLICSIYILWNCTNMVPLAGAATGGILLGALSILLIVFGYRVINKDY